MKQGASFYKGRPSNPDSVKKRVVFQGLSISIDRPKGFTMNGVDKSGTPWKREYKLDYGFLPRTNGGDGEGIDVFLGPNSDAPTAFWAIQNKPDGSFDEYKVMLGFDSRAAAKKAYTDHIPSKYLAGMAAMPIQMMKAMLNIEPVEKLAMKLGFFDELDKLSTRSVA